MKQVNLMFLTCLLVLIPSVGKAQSAVQQAMDNYDPAVIGYVWDDSNPRIQLEPRGSRGYIEMRAIKRK